VVKKLTFLDQAFGFTDSENSPKHVAGLQFMKLPENADKFYVPELTKNDG